MGESSKVSEEEEQATSLGSSAIDYKPVTTITYWIYECPKCNDTIMNWEQVFVSDYR